MPKVIDCRRVVSKDVAAFDELFDETCVCRRKFFVSNLCPHLVVLRLDELDW